MKKLASGTSKKPENASSEIEESSIKMSRVESSPKPQMPSMDADDTLRSRKVASMTPS